jgi:hypothetical protein
MAHSTATRPVGSFGASSSAPECTTTRPLAPSSSSPLFRPSSLSLSGLGGPSAQCQECLPPIHSNRDSLLQLAHRLRRLRSSGSSVTAEPLPIRPQASAASLIQSLRVLLGLPRFRRGEVRHVPFHLPARRRCHLPPALRRRYRT